MRIMWHSNHPETGSGYGTQTKLWVPRLASLGHEVAISSFFGIQGRTSDWQGHKVYPSGDLPYGSDVVGMHAVHFGADLVITLMDQWALAQDTLMGQKVACWMPVDTEWLSVFDVGKLPGRWPIAFTRWGEKQLKDTCVNGCSPMVECKHEHFQPLYVPHGIDTQVFQPVEDRKNLRESMGMDDKFIVLMVAANQDKSGRKSWPESMYAFAKFAKKHKDAVLVCHTLDHTLQGINLRKLVERFGIADRVVFSAQYLMMSGQITPEQLRYTYCAADVLLACSKAEGFCLPVMEALACGTPAIVTDGSALTEVGGPAAWKVKGNKLWANGHEAWWTQPDVDAIERALERAYERGGPYHSKVKAARQHALQYDVDRVLTEYWKPCLETIEGWL